MDKEIAQQLMSYVEQAKTFAEKEAPVVVEEILQWKYWESICYLSVNSVLLIMLSIIIAILIKTAIKNHRSEHPDDDIYFPCYFGSVILSVFAVIPLFNCCVFFAKLIKISTAPRLVVLEYLGKLVN